MFKIPKEYFKNETIYKNIGSDTNNGMLSCGFLNKKNSNNSDVNLMLEYYGTLLILSGEGHHIDSYGQEHKLYPGCMVQRLPKKCHSTYVNPDGNWLEFFICFGKGIFKDLANLNILDNNNEVLYPGINATIFEMFIDFFNCMKNANEEDLPFLLCDAQKIIITLYSMHKDNTTGDYDKNIIHEACMMINKEPYSFISSHDVCSELDIGYEKFRKLFKLQIGISPGEYIIQKRINTAKSLLIKDEKSIKEIAMELDYPDAYTFSKQFKKIVGMAPNNFKKIY